MPIRILPAFALASIAAGVAVTAFANPVRHAGEWETVINGGQPMIVCTHEDRTLDEASITRQMSQLPGASCKTTSFTATDTSATYALECTINGAPMSTSGTITMTGPDSFSAKIHSHGGAIPMANGKTVTIPDTETTTVSRRLGPCKPGDPESKY